MSNINPTSNFIPNGRLQTSSSMIAKIDIEDITRNEKAITQDREISRFASNKRQSNPHEHEHQQQNSSQISSSIVAANPDSSSVHFKPPSNQGGGASYSQFVNRPNHHDIPTYKMQITPPSSQYGYEKKANLRKMNLPFPWKLHTLLGDLQRQGRQHIASWLPSGKSFRVHQPDEFSKRVMGDYFRQTKFNSFTRRKLNNGIMIFLPVKISAPFFVYD